MLLLFFLQLLQCFRCNIPSIHIYLSVTFSFTQLLFSILLLSFEYYTKKSCSEWDVCSWWWWCSWGKGGEMRLSPDTHTHAEQVSELNWLWVNSSAFLIISILRDVHNTKIYRYVLYVHHTRIYACLKYSIQVVVSFSSEMVFLLFLFSGSRFRFLIDLKGLFFSTSYDYYVVPCETNDTTFGLLLL